MVNLRKLFALLVVASAFTASAGAQVRFDVNTNPYAGPGLTVSVGNNGYYQQPYNSGYVVYPVANTRGHRRGPAVVLAPGYPQYNTGYFPNGSCNNNGYYVNNNGGYYNQGYTQGYNTGYGYANQGYSTQGYSNQGYYNPGYSNQGYRNNNRRCR